MPRKTRRVREQRHDADTIGFGALISLVAIALGAILPLGLAPLQAAESPPGPGAKADYNRDVRPILAKNCFACHGQDEAKRAKGLRLDRRDSAVKPAQERRQ